MPLSTFLESTKNHEADHAEGCLFLCESDLLSALHLSHSAAGAQPSAQDAAGVLLLLKGQPAVAAC